MDNKPETQNNLTPKQVPIKTLVLYTSETGNAEQISEDLLDDMKQNKENDGVLKNLKRYKLNKLLERGKQPKKGEDTFELQDKSSIKVCIIVASSTGNGDCPENGEQFFRFLRRQTNMVAEGQVSNQLSHVFYTVLGLGSTDYSKYQHIPRFIDKKLELLGAKKFYYRGEADDATGLEEAVEPWLEGVQESIRKCIKDIKKMDQVKFNEIMKEQNFEEKAQEGAKPEQVVEETVQKSTQITYFGNITKLKQLNKGVEEKYGADSGVKPVYLGVLSFGRSIDKDKIQPGQSFSLYPHNRMEDVDQCIEAFGWNASELLGNKTVKQLLCEDVDIKSLQVNIDKLWSDVSSGKTAKSGPFREYFDMLKKKSRQDITCLYDIAKYFLNNPELAKLDEAQIPQYMVEESNIIPRIKPRFYSVSNDPFMGQLQQKTKDLEIIISETKFKKGDEQRLGMCTDFLTNPQNLNTTEFKCQFSSSYRVLNLPQAPAKSDSPIPLILIAHGTGIAPFISMLQNIAFNMQHQQFQILLIFGTRDNSTDFLFSDVLIPFFKFSEQSQLLLTCSRQIDEPEEKVDSVHYEKGYVQAVIQSDPQLGRSGKLSDLMKKMLTDERALVQVCGNESAMGKEVMEALQKTGVIENDQALQDMKMKGKILMELWGE